MEKTLQEQLDEVNAKLSAEKDLGSQKDAEKIAVLEQQQADILKAIMDATQATALADQEQAIQLKIESETREVEYFLDNLEVDGISMRELFISETHYQYGRISVQSELIRLVEKYNDEIKLIQIQHKEFERAAADREIQLQRQNDELQEWSRKEREQAIKDAQEFAELESRIAQLSLEKQDAEAKRDAAVTKADGLELLVQEKQAQIDILRTEAAVGAKSASHVIDIEAQREQMKTLADQIKASRIKVYDVKPDRDLNPTSYTAKRVDNDEEVTYNWTQEKKYEVMDTEQVLQFRNEYAQENNLPDLTLVNPVIAEVVALDITVTAEQFRGSLDSAQEDKDALQEDSGSGSIPGDAESVAGATVTREEFDTLKHEVTMLAVELKARHILPLNWEAAS